VYHLGRRLKDKAERDGSPVNARLRALTWNYRTEGPHAEPDVDQVLQESTALLAADRSCRGYTRSRMTAARACGCWIYSGVYPSAGRNRAQRARSARPVWTRLGILVAVRSPHPLQPRVGAARRAPWSERQEARVVGSGQREWTGLDTPDFAQDEGARLRARLQEHGCEGLRGDAPFIMHPDGVRMDLGGRAAEGRSAAGAL
jgi:formate dehydrogenase major subunit